ncbi:MAG TPA: hypothetical protein VHR72_07860, partial [Gemmataceae bacterium]|nr:hypothetical protein [Gemmataceae bacterium]
PTARRIGPVLVTLALLCFATAVRADEPAKLRVGFASVDVTPDVTKAPVYLAGFGKNRRATKVHDPLYVRTIVLADGAKTIAFSCVDVIGLFHDIVEHVRPRLPELTYLVVSSTHSHHGPDTVGMWGPSLFQTGADPAYLKRIEEAVVASVGQARSKMHDVAEVRVGTARDGDLLHDSRKPIVKHDEIVVLRFTDADKKVLGTLVQWNCHPEAIQRNNTEVSADYVPATVAYLEKRTAAPVVYLSGTVGGLMSPIHVKKNDETGAELTDGSFPMCERYGVLVGRLAEKALSAGKIRPLTPFVVRSRELYLPIDNSGYMLGYRLGVLKRVAYRWTGDVGNAETPDPKDGKAPLCCKTEIARLTLGDVDIACIPGEIYPELVLGKVVDPAEPEADFPHAPIEPSIYGQLDRPVKMMIGLANDEIGYILPKRQWDAEPPYCYGLKTRPYGEINSLGPDTAPLLCEAFRKLAATK